MKFVLIGNHVHLLQSRMVSPAYPNRHSRPFPIPEKIPENGPARIHSADTALCRSDVFLTETDHHERILKYRAFQACRGSVEKNLRKASSVTRRGNGLTGFLPSDRHHGVQPGESVPADTVGIRRFVIHGTIVPLRISSSDRIQVI